ncbi:MAG: hypothetical protein ABIO94_10450 [Opitutaceae bacterium]
MKSFPKLAWCLGLFAGVVIPLVAAKDKGLDVFISADAIPSPEGFRPKPGKPIHYVLTQNRQTLGEAVGGVKLPNPTVVEGAVVAELQKQGFVRTAVGGPIPEIVIMATVGDANFEPPPVPSGSVNPLFEPDFGPYLEQVNLRRILESMLLSEKVPNTIAELFPSDATGPKLGFPSSDSDVNQARDLALAEAIRIRERGSPRSRDRGKIVALVGAPKVDRAVAESTMSNAEAERVVWLTHENQYYVTLTAFDAMRWKEKRQVLLWRTTMLIDWRKDFTKSLTDMLAQAGPTFGTDITVPGFVNTAPHQGKVEIGDAKVVSEKDSAVKPEPKK